MQSQKATCHYCGKVESVHILCSHGHYVCDDCHGQGALVFIQKFLKNSVSTDAQVIAEELFAEVAHVPMLGCEHALVIVAATMGALRNAKLLGVGDALIAEALQRTKRQAIGGYCGLTGICGVAVGVGACFSVMLGAACPKDCETAATMHVVADVIAAIGDNTGPCCCKNFVNLSIPIALAAIKELWGAELPSSKPSRCQFVAHHPHGCRTEKCAYYQSHQATMPPSPSWGTDERGRG